MIKVVYNACFGGFTLSKLAIARLIELGITELEKDEYYIYSCQRHDPRIVLVVEELGDLASGECSKLRIASVENNKYRIQDFDGKEKVLEYSLDDSEFDWIKL